MYYKQFEHIIASHNFLCKLNLKSSMKLPILNNGVVQLSNSRLSHQAFHSIFLTYLALTLFNSKPMPVFMRNSIINFRVRKGDLAGIKLMMRSEQLYEFIEVFSTRMVSALASAGYFANTGINKSGVETISLPELKLWDFYYDTLFARVSYLIGFDISMNFNQQVRLNKASKIIFLSSFKHF